MIPKPKAIKSVRDIEQLPKTPNCCGTCVKIRKVHDMKYECGVLHEMIGMEKECWSWSGDPGWWEETERSIQKYTEIHGGNGWGKWNERRKQKKQKE